MDDKEVLKQIKSQVEASLYITLTVLGLAFASFAILVMYSSTQPEAKRLSAASIYTASMLMGLMAGLGLYLVSDYRLRKKSEKSAGKIVLAFECEIARVPTEEEMVNLDKAMSFVLEEMNLTKKHDVKDNAQKERE